MQNKKTLLTFIFWPVFLATVFTNLPGQSSIPSQTEPSIFSKKPKSPLLSPERRITIGDSIPTMEQITEQVQPSEQPSKNEQPSKPQKKSKKSYKKVQVKENVVEENVNEKLDIENKEQAIEKKLCFGVENTTGQSIYIVCFAYIKKRAFGKWRWQKSAVQKLENKQTITICTDEIEDDEDRDNTFGYLGVFENLNEAQESTFETLPDKKKIDLDLIVQLKDKTVKIEIEKYGIVGNFYDYDFVKSKDKKNGKIPELDFIVENKTGKTIFVTCFVYEKKAKSSWLAKKTSESWTDLGESRDDMSVWRFDKTPVIKINPNEKGEIDVDTIIEPRDREYVRGYLVLFDENEQELAEAATYELLPENTKKLDLGRLINLKNKKIEIYAEKYGTSDFIDYTVQPTRRVDLSKITSKIG